MLNRGRFTLIELLVVVAIIAILAAILLPVLSRARYTAKNVICISNQSQVARGVILYTDDYDAYYPARSDDVVNEAPEVVQRDASTTDYISQLKPYFGPPLKGTWTCPLAPNEFQVGGATWDHKSRDLDTTTGSAMTSYAHFYGRVRATGAPNVKPPGWGTGSFRPVQPMRKVGDPFVDLEYWSGKEQSFRVLTGDNMWLWNSSTLAYTHQTPGEPPILDADPYKRRKVNPQIAILDYNYTMDDGSAHSVSRVRAYDTRITLNRKPSTWGWAWILPLPE